MQARVLNPKAKTNALLMEATRGLEALSALLKNRKGRSGPSHMCTGGFTATREGFMTYPANS